MEIKRAYKFRFYPTPEQEITLARTFGSARFAYNYMLKARTDAWYNHQKKVGYHETSAMLTALGPAVRLAERSLKWQGSMRRSPTHEGTSSIS